MITRNCVKCGTSWSGGEGLPFTCPTCVQTAAIEQLEADNAALRKMNDLLRTALKESAGILNAMREGKRP